MLHALRLAIGVFLLTSIAGCGFRPSGEVPLAPPLHHLFLQTSDPYGELSLDLKQSLKLSNVTLAASAPEAATVLDILREDTNQQLLSVSGSQQTRQYNLVLTVTFQVTDNKGRIILAPESLSESRTIPIRSNQTLGGSNEASNLFRQMRQDIVYSIMNRLSSQQVSKLVMKKP